MVLWGRYWNGPKSYPTIIPELQNRSAISVVVGDDHFGALTSSGKLLTWGEYSGGALGLGGSSGLTPETLRGYTGGEQAHAPPEVTVPTEVRFDHHEQLKGEGRVERYCFAVTAFSNHTAALVVDLAGDEVLPEGPKRTVLRGVYSSPACNRPQFRALAPAHSTAQGTHDPHTGSSEEGVTLPTHVYFA